MNEEILKERERIKAEVIRIIESFIETREKKIKYKRYRNTTLLKKVEEIILFYIDHPEYKRKEAE